MKGYSSAKFSINHTTLDVSSNPEDIDYLDQVCLIRGGAKLSRAVEFETNALKPLKLYLLKMC